MLYYVVDTTLKTPLVAKFSTYPELVIYLEGISQRAYGQSRKERMILLEEVGHGEDDRQGVNFVRSMAENFNMGVVREGQLVRCDVIAVALYQKEEYGN